MPCITYSALVAHQIHSFYNGGSREREILWRAYLRLIKHINSIYKACLKLNYITLDAQLLP